MKKITIKHQQGQPIVIYVADNVFAHMRPAPTEQLQTQMLEFIAMMLAKSGKTENHYLQYAYFNPAGNNQLSLYFARESEPKDVTQAKPEYKPDSVIRDEFFIQIEDAPAQEAMKADERFLGLKKAAKEAIKGEHLPPFRKENELHQSINQDSKERRKEAAAKLYKRLHTNEQDAEEKAGQFSVFVATPEVPFSHEVNEFTQRQEITSMGEFIDGLSKKSDGESVDVTKYRETLADNLQDELNAAQEATTSVINDNARQLDLHEKRSRLQDNIASYTASRDDKARIMSVLATAVYNAAKDYYLSIWENDKISLDTKIPAFNAIFGKLIQIDPDNLSLTSIDNVFATLMQSKMKVTDVEKIMTDMLNAAYGKIGSQEWQASRDAIEFLIQHINKMDPEHTCLPKIERIKYDLKMIVQPKHHFRFSDVARKQLEAFDAANQQLLEVKKDDVDEIHFAGTSLVDVARKVKEAAQSEFNNLSALTSMLGTSRANLEKFSAIVAQKDDVSNKLTAIQGACPNPDDIQSPAADPALRGLSTVVTQLLGEQINGEKAALREAVQAFHANIQAQQTELASIMARARESAITLTPLSLNEFDRAFSAANDRAESLKTDLTALQQQAEFAQMRIQIHKKDAYDILQCQLLVNAIYNLEYWKTTTGTFGIQANVTINGQSSIVPREIGGMLNMVRDIQHDGWDHNPDTARALIGNLQDYAAQHRTSNQNVNRLYDAIRGTQPANNNTPLNSISEKIQSMGRLLPQPLTRISDAQTYAPTVTPSRFWQRHPVLKKALLGALIGTIVPVVGTIIGLIIGTVIGKRDEKRAAQPQRVAQRASNNPFDAPATAEETRSLLPKSEVVGKRDKKRAAQPQSKSTNPFDAPATAEETRSLLANGDSSRSTHGTVSTKLDKQFQGNPFANTEESRVEAVQRTHQGRKIKLFERENQALLDDLDKMVARIEAIDPNAVKKPTPSMFDPTADAKILHDFENAFVSNLLGDLYALKARRVLDKDLPALQADFKRLRTIWNAKEKIQKGRDHNLKNLIEVLQQAHPSTCTLEFIKEVVQKTAQQHPNLDARMFATSPLKNFGIVETVAKAQQNRLM